MQSLPTEILSETRKERMKILDFELQEFVKGSKIGEMIQCPKCNYVSKNNRFSCEIFQDSIKCFACGLWRRL